MKALRRVAILGAGTMGSRIAAHFANAGIPALLLDLPGLAKKGWDAALKGKPPALFADSAARLVSQGSLETDLPLLADCDWILEAVVENLDIKRDLWNRVLAQAPPGAILSTNTSGIPLHRIVEGWPEQARRRFLGAALPASA
jgi:3-hydroxyacyl-CoA dehydrogenase